MWPKDLQTMNTTNHIKSISQVNLKLQTILNKNPAVLDLNFLNTFNPLIYQNAHFVLC